MPRKTVVIVDDSPYMTGLLSDFFADKLDFRVVATGHNGMQAIVLYNKHKPDLMTMDLSMPVKDGKTALKEVLAKNPEARILLITSQLGAAVVECLKIGAAGYVQKPLRFNSQEFVEEFTEAVNSALSA